MGARLEDIKNGASVRGITSAQPVQVVSVDWIGDQAISVVFRDHSGTVAESILYRDDEHRLEVEKSGRPWSFDADGALLRLVTEANRIKLAHYFDPYLAIHTSLVDPLPHQISAVYGEMLPRQPLRFLLADDPGAGKTIMAGLLIKELIARSDLERCLVVAPGSLVEQWQDELGQKFNLEFDILTRDMIETSRSGNPFSDRNRLIVRLDVLARNEELQDKLMSAQEWDLIICDEAHRMSATYFGGEVKYTKRYQIGQKLGQACRHLLLMSATPHNGKEEDFQLFMALLDGDRFEGRFRDGVHYADTEDMMRRLTKEELLKFDGRPLFPERRAYTVKYELSEGEAALYTAVTEYVRTEMNRVQRFAEGDGKKRNNVGFALQILQRRLASSPAAIYQSLKRRRERLESELGEARLATKGRQAGFDERAVNADILRNIEEYGQEEIDELEDLISTGATTAETVEQLALEVETLKSLEAMALGVLRSGVDTKWSQLNRILDDDLMIDSAKNRRKLIIFTEPKDTLNYLLEKVRARLGNPEAVDVIHGGVSREERRKVVERFMQDKDLLVLIANDAAGEGVNLQRGHLMVNYDLPWNPNKIEQRFGRVHRIGQTEVCHLWNLVAADTREGEVYARLLEKLEAAREALGGRVYDVLGELFEGTALKDLLFQAIQYGEQDDVKARLLQQVDGAVDRTHLLELLRRRALTNDTMPEAKVEELRLEMERAEALRLQPHHIQSFFVEAFQHLGGRLKRREEGRWEVTHVPVRIRERDRQIGTGAPIQKQYERICFEKSLINQQPVAAFICPGHPLLEAVISLIREQYEQIMRQGAILVDDTDPGDSLSAIFLLEHAVQDGRMTSGGKPHVISQRLQFAAIDKAGDAVNAGIAPHLNLRPATTEEIDAVGNLLDEDWLTSELEKTAIRFATVELAQGHVAEIKARRLPEIDKVEQEVRARLKKEINYWDSRAFELKEEEKAGKKARLSWQNAQRRAEELAERQKRRMDQLEQERFITSQPPRVRGGMVVIPRGLLVARQSPAVPDRFAEDPAARRAIELAAMEAVMAAERALGHVPVDVSAQKIGYDIASHDPKSGHLRFIEVKGRIDGADTVMLTRQEIITSLHEPEKFILAIVSVNGGFAHVPRYVRGPLVEREPSFLETAIQFDLRRLLERAREPA
ncbi:helicase-related protein [Parvibaculum sp.]|uniref:helicase-related protein n=1 Tax=Parvibaculum sp. TaxID=2024848 RepID=UPI000C52F5D9|nr:helicase-related protein [Parvibaculum sp.]MAM94935.1 RNA helicase [Parvibaculum sp.]|tara:strand:- start:19897 stop:23400 length:3504 start_codon:yes stop_codon:yes gene_type:complete